MQRRDFLKSSLKLSSLALAAKHLPAQMPMPAPAAPATPADITLRIAPVTVELAPDRILSTIGYNGSSPGPVLRMKEGRPTTIDVVNATDVPELVHWHGLLIPAEVDGVDEEGTPVVPAQSRRRYQFTPRPAGSRWYHSHAMAESDLHKGSYTGQFGFLIIDPANDPGQYEQEIFLALRDWEPFFTTQMEDTDEQGQVDPQPEKPAVMNTNPNGFEVNSLTYSINDKSLGAGEPLRVKEGQRVLLRILNASAIENRRLALPGHKFKVIALDGNPVPNPALVETLFLGAGERIDAIVEMNNPGVWILGGTEDQIRTAGLGVIVEYANSHKQPTWHAPSTLRWDYTVFGNAAGSAKEPDHILDMIFEKIPGGSGKFNTWLVNGKPYPHENEFVLTQGQRYRLVFRNRTDDAHPLHLHRHNLELTEVNLKKTSGIMKDTVVVPYYGRAAVDFTADQPGLTLFHCHIQNHMDFGFKALFKYA